MLTVSYPLRRLPILSIHHRWMARRPRWRDVPGLAVYYNCRSTAACPGFLRFPKKVLDVDLRPGAEAILAACDESSRYKIRRAARDGITTEIEKDPSAFVSYYNAFAKTKGIGDMAEDYWQRYDSAATITKAVFEGETLAMHSYFVDEDVKRATLLYSCSLFRDVGDSQRRSLMGRANRYLYWDDMRRFAEAGMDSFDFGYYGDPRQLEKVNEFKKGFPCVDGVTSTYVSLPFWLFRKITSPGVPF